MRTRGVASKLPVLLVPLVLLVAGCAHGSWSRDLAIGEADFVASSICSPSDSDGLARFGADGVENHSDQRITITDVKLDDRHGELELVRYGFISTAGREGPFGFIGPYKGQFDGVESVIAEPGEWVIVDLLLRNPTDELQTMYGMTVSGVREDGVPVQAHTCWSFGVLPVGEPECGDDVEGEEEDMEYLDVACTRPLGAEE